MMAEDNIFRLRKRPWPSRLLRSYLHLRALGLSFYESARGAWEISR